MILKRIWLIWVLRRVKFGWGNFMGQIFVFFLCFLSFLFLVLECWGIFKGVRKRNLGGVLIKSQ